MRVGVAIPSFGELSTSPGVAALAKMAEDAGADGVWVPDHLCVPKEHSTPYPYSTDGEFPFPADTPWLDCLTALAAIAATTHRVTIGTAVLVLSQRSPLEVAKVTATLDQISGGRLRLGVGAGWFKEEIQALGYAAATRGRRLDDALQILQDCWRGETSGYAGAELSVDAGLMFMPRPVESSVPLYIGGSSRRALRRAARLGDGWMPGSDIGMLDLEDLARLKDELAALREELGRGKERFE
ncbi:MAG: TIGR03619 family F420-dependent LLM class oxidoreductase, partial [Actinobacteria bacterium]|nr:TIGR03619 family F420-dependent LLM class oxidoreductase [Actinomycetota bacterium]